MFAELADFLRGDQRGSVLVVQLGASSGREIASLARQFPAHNFLFTDIDNEICLAAQQRFPLANLECAPAFANDLPEVVQASHAGEVLVFASGSAQYVFPEHLHDMFEGLASISTKTIHVVVMEPGSDIEGLQASNRGSQPRGNFSYTHDYSWYARRLGWREVRWSVIRPYLQEDPIHGQTVHLFGWFTKESDPAHHSEVQHGDRSS
jgi:hypothetical protein